MSSNPERRPRARLLGSCLLIVASVGCQQHPSSQKSIKAEAVQPKPGVPAPSRELTPSYNSALAASSTSALTEVTTAPDVKLKLQDGFEFPLSSLRGKFVTIFFCASMRSAACIGTEHALRDSWRALHEERMVPVVGVTRESPAEQQAFLKEHALPFDLVSDPDGVLAQKFGLPASGDYDLHTFVVGRDGRICKSWKAANSESQTRELLALVSEPAIR